VKQYVGLDGSMEETNVCVLDDAGMVVFVGSTPSRPEALTKLLRAQAQHAERIALETGSLSSWLWCELKVVGFPIVCLDAVIPRPPCRCGSTRPIGMMPEAWLSWFA